MGGNIPEPAVILRNLIEGGPQSVSLTEPLPPPWDALYDAVAPLPDPQTRWEAFHRALTDHPDRVRMTLIVQDALEPLVGGSRQRIKGIRASTHWEQQPTSPPVFIPAAHALAPRARREWLVEGLVARPSLNLLVGPAGAKKTYAALDLAVSAARAQPWLSRGTRQANVLWIDEESGPHRFLDRLAQLMRAHQAGPELPFHLASLAGFDLRSPADLETLAAKAQEISAGLIVIDPLIGVIPGIDENSVFHLAPLFRSLRALANRTNAALLLIHHTNKSGLYRGSTHLRAAVDLMLTAHSAPHTPYVEFRTEKTRDIAPQRFAARAHFEPPGPDPQRVWFTPANLAKVHLNVQPLSPAVQHVIEYLEKHGPSPTKAIIASPQGCTPAQARRAIFPLLQAGLIERTDPGNQGSPATYALVE